MPMDVPAAFNAIWRGDLSLNRSEAAVLVLTLAYLLSPIDAIPDFLPVIGWLDDGVALYLCYMSLSSAVVFATGYLRAVERAGTSNCPIGEEPVLFEHDDDEECVICEGERGERGTTLLPCGHQFCKQDAETLMTRRATCPFCRRQIRSLRHRGTTDD